MPLPRAFWRFASASAAANLADGVVQVALPLLALQLTRSPLQVAGLAFASGLPWLLFALLAGAVSDRWDRRRLMAVCSALRVGVLALLAVLTVTDAVALWHLYVVAVALGVVETFFDTAAQSVLPMAVGAEQLPAANSRLYGIETVGQVFAGPPLGGFLAGISLALAVGAGASAHAVALLALLTLGGRYRPSRPVEASDGGIVRSLHRDIGEGWRYLWRDAVLRRLALLTGAALLAANSASAVLVLFAVAPGPMGLSESGFGLLLAATGLGAVAAALVADRVVERLGPARALRLAMVAFAGLVAAPLLERPVLVAVALAVGAAGVIVFNVVTVSLRQRRVPEHLLGRVNSVYRLVAWGGRPVGAVLGGVLADLAGLRTVFVVAGAVTLALALGLRGLDDERLR